MGGFKNRIELSVSVIVKHLIKTILISILAGVYHLIWNGFLFNLHQIFECFIIISDKVKSLMKSLKKLNVTK